MRADRLISILMHLQIKGRMTAMELARLLEVSERTIYRDIDALSTSGVPLYADPGVGGGFSLPADYRTKVDGLTTPEIHALFLNLTDRPLQQLGIGSSLRSALLKLLNALPNQGRQDVEWIQNRVYLDMDTWRPRTDSPAFIQIAQQAIWAEKQAALTYTTRSGEEIERIMKPYGLVAKTGMWFIVGLVGEQTVAFRLSRICSFQVMEATFKRPDKFDLQAAWRQWIVQFEARKFLYSVILEVAPEGLPLLSQVIGDATRQQEAVAEAKTEVKTEVKAETEAANPTMHPNWLRFTLIFENEEIARSRILALGLQAEVIQPLELRQSIRSYAADVLQFYS